MTFQICYTETFLLVHIVLSYRLSVLFRADSVYEQSNEVNAAARSFLFCNIYMPIRCYKLILLRRIKVHSCVFLQGVFVKLEVGTMLAVFNS
uniref:Uncharacterized protein n=1 Tax=Arundo donax TaxID=35708 RepID=A0A0A8ZPB3_ARUDO